MRVAPPEKQAGSRLEGGAPAARFGETLELRPTRRQHVLHHATNAAIGLVMAALGVFAATAADMPLRILGAIVAALGGVMLFRTAPDLFGPPNAYLLLTEEGFEAHRRSESAFVPWAAVERFYLTARRRNAPPLLMWEWNGSHAVAPPSVKGKGAFRYLLRKSGLPDRVVFQPPGFSSEEMLPILTAWHERALGQGG